MGIAYSQGTDPGTPTINASTCNACGQCARVCPSHCYTTSDGGMMIDRDAGIGCIACGQCVMVCPTDSIHVTGRGIERSGFVPLPDPCQRATADQLEALLLSRRSVRHFTNEEVSRDELDRIVSAAGLAPMGFPPSEVGVVILQGRQKVRELAWEGVDAYRNLLKLADRAITRAIAKLLLRRSRFQWLYNGIVPLGRSLVQACDNQQDISLYDAPAALIFHCSPYGEGADPHLACTYAMLQAEAMGLGTTMIGAVPGPLAKRKDILRKYGIPLTHKLQLVLIIGHPAIRYRQSVRRQLGWVRYQ